MKKIEFSHEIVLIRLVDDMALVVALPLAFRGFVQLIRTRNGFFLFFLLFLFLMIGLVSGTIHNIPLRQMLFQFALELKFPLMLCVIYGLPDKQWFRRSFINFAKIIMLASIPLILWQFTDPSSYHLFFFAGGDKGFLHLPGGTTLPRASGVLWATGQLAMFAGTIFIFFYFNYLYNKSYRYLLWSVISFLLLLSALSRLEIVATIFGIWLALIMSQKGVQKIITCGIIVMLILPASSFIIQLFQLTYDRLELNNIYLSQAARVVFYYYSVIIAAMYFPFGSGLGTYGGYSSVVYDADIYYLLNFHGYGWFQRRWMTDTFWPHILGETGVFGLLFYLGALFYLWRIVLYSRERFITTLNFNSEDIILMRTSIAVLTLVCLNSFATPVFYSVTTLIPCLLLIIITSEYDNNSGYSRN